MRYGLQEAKELLLEQLDAAVRGREAPVSFPVVIRFKVPLIEIDQLDWLSGQKNARKIFWSSVDGGIAVAGVGAAFEASAEGWYGFDDVWAKVHEYVQACPEARFFSGMSFARTITGVEWKGFPAIRFILPAVELVKDADGFWLAANAVRGRDGEPFGLEPRHVLERMRLVEQVSPGDAVVVSREDVPDYEDWVCSAEAVLESLEKEGLEKVVLARRVTFEIKGSVTAEMALKTLMGQQKFDHAFMFSFGGRSFLGVSSDPLYVRQGGRVQSRAVAGHPPGKDRREHRLVAGALVEVFREFCRSYQVDLEQAPFMRLSGVLSEGVTDKEFLQALHPAPIVCGVPAEKARLALQQYEVFDRGWFCGSAGFFSKGAAALALARHACLLETGNLHAYAGAPFVSGADPFTQWEQAAQGMKNILNVVHGAQL